MIGMVRGGRVFIVVVILQDEAAVMRRMAADAQSSTMTAGSNFVGCVVKLLQTFFEVG